jgi:hypothetical protein
MRSNRRQSFEFGIRNAECGKKKRGQTSGFIGLLHLPYLKELAKNTTRKNKKGAGYTFSAPFLLSVIL